MECTIVARFKKGIRLNSVWLELGLGARDQLQVVGEDRREVSFQRIVSASGNSEGAIREVAVARIRLAHRHETVERLIDEHEVFLAAWQDHPPKIGNLRSGMGPIT